MSLTLLPPRHPEILFYPAVAVQRYSSLFEGQDSCDLILATHFKI